MIRKLVDFAGGGDAMVAKGGELLLLEVCDEIPRILSVSRSLASTTAPPRTVSKTICRETFSEIPEIVNYRRRGNFSVVSRGRVRMPLEVCDGVGYDIASHLAIEVNRGVGVILEVYLAQSLCCWVGHKR